MPDILASQGCLCQREKRDRVAMLKKLLIVVVESDPDRTRAIADGLGDVGDHDIRILAEHSALARRVADEVATLERPRYVAGALGPTTRTASISGGFVALVLALQRLKERGTLKQIPITDYVAATSVGIVDKQVLLDLCYEEDFRAEVDFNVVMTDRNWR